MTENELPQPKTEPRSNKTPNELLGLHEELLETIGTECLRDYTPLWQLPFSSVDSVAVVASPAQTKETREGVQKVGYIQGSRSNTEGRAYTLPMVFFQFNGGSIDQINEILKVKIPRNKLGGVKNLKPLVCCDILEKGGGVGEDLLPDEIPHINSDGKRVRYFSRELLHRTEPGPPAGATYDKGVQRDESFSFLFEAWGGRTRLPLATFPVEHFSTPEGVLDKSQAITLGYIDASQEPVLTLWGMRTRWRLDDISSLMGNPHMRSTYGLSDVFRNMLHPEVRFYAHEETPSATILQTGIEFAQEHIRKMKFDGDPRWQALAGEYPTVNAENISGFYLDYMDVLVDFIGENMGILYDKRVYLYMLNFQNFTALGELVDFDVALFDARNFIDGKLLSRETMAKNGMIAEEDIDNLSVEPDEVDLQANMFFNTLREITNLYAQLRMSGLINSNELEFQWRYDEAIRRYAHAFVQKGFHGSINPNNISRNGIFIRKLEPIIENSNWRDEPNPIGGGITGYEKALYGPLIVKLQKTRRKGLGLGIDYYKREYLNDLQNLQNADSTASVG